MILNSIQLKIFHQFHQIKGKKNFLRLTKFINIFGVVFDKENCADEAITEEYCAGNNNVETFLCEIEIPQNSSELKSTS